MPAVNPGTTNLVAWYTLESGGTDATGRGNDLSATGSPGYVAGVVGNAVDCSSGNYLSRADTADLSTGDVDFTICGWVKIDTTSGSNWSIIDKYGGAGSGLREYLVYKNPSNQAALILSSDGNTQSISVTASTFGALSAATWYFVAAWHDSVNNIAGISVNGTSNTSAYSSGVRDSSQAFRVGHGQFTGFDGKIDEVCMYKRVLTTDELTWLYNSGAGRTYADLAGGGAVPVFDAHYRMRRV